jgi:LacI family kdg operon repressor
MGMSEPKDGWVGKKMTISDIAQAAGVSKTTVSRYLNEKFDMMGPATRERIKHVIALSNYRPSTIAQSLKSKRTMQIGVIIADILSPFSTALLQGIGEVLDRGGYIPLIVNSGNDIRKEEKLGGELIRRGVDGLLVNTASYTNPFLIQVATQGIPVVLCDRYVKDYNFDIVTCEKKIPMYKLLRHLWHQGFSTPAFFVEEYEQNSTRYLRRKAFMESITRIYQIEDPESYVVLTDITNPENTERCLKKLIETEKTGKTPAAVACNTFTTLHLLSVIKRMGLNIPGDIGLCGPDDWNWGRQIEWSTLFNPSITTFSINAKSLGETAAELLMDRIYHPNGEKKKRVLPVKFTMNGSTLLH